MTITNFLASPKTKKPRTTVNRNNKKAYHGLRLRQRKKTALDDTKHINIYSTDRSTISFEQCQHDVLGLHNCCGKGINCFTRQFQCEDGTPDLNGAVSFYMSCAEIIQQKDRAKERGEYIMSKYKETLTEERHSKRNVSIKVNFKTIIPCKSSWHRILGIKKWEVEKASSTLKRFPDAVTIDHNPFKDHNLHPYNFADTEIMLRENDSNNPGCGKSLF